MKRIHAARVAVAATLTSAASAALAGGDAPSTEVAASGSNLVLLLGGLAVLGVVIWLMAKFMK